MQAHLDIYRQTYLHIGLSFVFKFSDVPGTSELRHTPIEASGGQEWYYVRSSWHLIILWVRLTFSQMSPSYSHLVMKTGTKLQGIMGSNCCHLLFNYWRCTSYIAMQENELIWVIENWKGNVCRLIFFLLLLMCNFVVVVKLYLWRHTYRSTTTTKTTKTTTTTTKRSIYIHFLFNFQECNWGGKLHLKGSTLYVIMLVRCTPYYRHLVTKSSTTSDQLDIYSQT